MGVMPVPRLVITMALPLMLSLLVQSLYNIVDGIFVGKISMVSLIAGALTNIILDPILIFTFHMGIEGAAIATVIGQWIGAAVALGLNAAANREIKFVWKGFRLTKEIVWPIYQVGLPTILTQAMGAIMLFSMNAILGAVLPGVSADGISAATPAIAFFGAYYKLQNFLYMPVMGLGQAAIPIVGFNYGAKNGERIRQVLRTAVPVAAGFALAGTILFETFPRRLLGIFSSSETALAIGVPGLRLIAVTFVFGAVTIVLGYICSGLGNGLANMIGTALRQFFPLIPLAWLFGILGGVNAIWYAMWISEALAALFSILYARRELRQKVALLVKKSSRSSLPGAPEVPAGYPLRNGV